VRKGRISSIEAGKTIVEGCGVCQDLHCIAQTAEGLPAPAVQGVEVQSLGGSRLQAEADEVALPDGRVPAALRLAQVVPAAPADPPREKRWHDLYRGRAAVEREFGRLKHEYGPTGRSRTASRNCSASAAATDASRCAGSLSVDDAAQNSARAGIASRLLAFSDDEHARRGRARVDRTTPPPELEGRGSRAPVASQFPHTATTQVCGD
jgi:hypothetical protein